MNAASTQPARILEPGLNTLPPAYRTLRGARRWYTALEHAAGDAIELVNPEGAQPARSRCSTTQGKATCSSSARAANGKAKASSHSRGHDASAIKLDERCDFATYRSRMRKARGFSAMIRRPGIRFASPHDRLTCVVAAPGEPMRADQQNTLDRPALCIRQPVMRTNASAAAGSPGRSLARPSH